MTSAVEAQEIERKFLLSGDLPDLSKARAKHLRQGYLATGAREVRLRTDGTTRVLTFKEGNGLVRREIEVDLSAQQFETLWPGTEGCRIEKTRYLLPHAGHTLEIDVYAGPLAPLRIAEVEFSSVEESERFSPPPFFGKEVTHDARFKNRVLATVGAPEPEGPAGP